MKTIKNFYLLLMAIVLCGGFTACSSDDDDNTALGGGATTAGPLVGGWEGTVYDSDGSGDMILAFYADGTGQQVLADNLHNFSYQYTGGVISLRYTDGDVLSYVVQSLSTNELVIRYAGERTTFSRITSLPINTSDAGTLQNSMRIMDMNPILEPKYDAFTSVTVYNYNCRDTEMKITPAVDWLQFFKFLETYDYDPQVGRIAKCTSFMIKSTSGNMTNTSRECNAYFCSAPDYSLMAGPAKIIQQAGGTVGGSSYEVTHTDVYLYRDRLSSSFDSYDYYFWYKWAATNGNVYLCKSSTDFSKIIGSGPAPLNPDTNRGRENVSLYKYRIVDYSNDGYIDYYYFDKTNPYEDMFQ